MRYVLGIHLGRTRVTASVCRHGAAGWDAPEIVPLGVGVPWIESVLHVSPEGDLLVGQAALHRAGGEPDRIARAPLHRTGDPVPIVLGGVPYPAESLAAGMIGWIADRVAEAESAQAERIVVTHPPGWSAYRRGLLHDALDRAELPGVLALPCPIAAAESCATGVPGTPPGNLAAPTADGRLPDPAAPPEAGAVPVGGLLGVGVLGGIGAQAALLRRTTRGFELLSHAESYEPEAGARLDDLLVERVVERGGFDENDPQLMAHLRTMSAAAKERLAHTTTTAVTESVSITREEFDDLARPVLSTAIGRLRRLTSAAPTDDLASVVLVGGSARLPLVGELARTMISVPVTVDDDPGTALCRGAALAARPRPAPAEFRGEEAGADAAVRSVEGAPPDSGTLVTTVHGLPAAFADHDPEHDRQEHDEEPPPGRPPVEITPLDPPKRRFAFARRGSSSDTRDGGR
ncbi:Hsp70 family protein [Saccharomonospora iraqiensis]|uniref:Hsp70 family protein n=1 Tax=Saccharomonospora iraqiensis TaxID=52698 RepID=UPI00022DF909|nr:Hsp70 family protein [Saccharomonospora iraqiensis]